MELEWQETYREMARVESLLNSYQQLKLNLVAKLDTLELKKSEYVKKKTKLIGEMSCLPLSDKIIDGNYTDTYNLIVRYHISLSMFLPFSLYRCHHPIITGNAGNMLLIEQELGH